MKPEDLPFPTRITSSRAVVEQTYVVLSDTRAEDPEIHYSVTVPKHWKLLDVAPESPSEKSPIATLGVFRSGHDPRMELEVIGAYLPREVEPSDWLHIWLEEAGQSIVHSQAQNTRSGEVLDALTQHEVDGRMVYHRWKATKQGSLLLVVDARGYEDSIVSQAETYYIATMSTKLLQPPEWPLAEDLATFTQAEPAEFLLAYPKSWTLQLDPESGPKGLSLNLLNIMDDLVMGSVMFVVVPDPAASPEALRDRLWAELGSEDYVGVLPALAPASETPGMPSRLELVAPVTRRTVPHELRLSIGSAAGATWLVGMTGPAREVDSQVWAINKRAYRIVLNQLRTKVEDPQ